MTNKPKTLRGALLDAVVYAPVGLMSSASEQLPRLATGGRQQITMARLIGQLAVTELTKPEVQRQLRDHADATLTAHLQHLRQRVPMLNKRRSPTSRNHP